LDEVKDGGREIDSLTGLAMLNVHRDITVSVDSVKDRFAKSKKRFLYFVV